MECWGRMLSPGPTKQREPEEGLGMGQFKGTPQGPPASTTRTRLQLPPAQQSTQR